MDGNRKGLKGDRRSLTLHGPHTPGTSRSCQILASHQGFSRREQHTSFSREKSYTSCHFFGKSTSFYRGEWGKGNGPLGTPRDKKGKGCHDLSRRWEAMPRSPLMFRSLATISLSVSSRFKTPTLGHQTSDLPEIVNR